MNIHQLRFVLNAYPSSHLLIMNQQVGMPMMLARKINFMFSMFSNPTIVITDAPITFLTPISLVLLEVENRVRPNRPMLAIKIARNEKVAKTRPYC